MKLRKQKPTQFLLTESQAKQLGLIKMAARIQFAAQKNMGKTPMVFHDPHQLELRVHAAAMKAGFVGPAVRKLTQAKAEQQLSLICPAVQHQRAMMESHGAKTPGHFIRLALEMYLPEVRPGLHFRHEPIAEEEHWARENEKRLSRSARYKEFRPYVLVAEPRSGSPEETKWQKQERTGSPF